MRPAWIWTTTRAVVISRKDSASNWILHVVVTRITSHRRQYGLRTSVNLLADHVQSVRTIRQVSWVRQGACNGGLRDCSAVRVKFEVCSGIVLGRALTTSPSTGLEVSVPGRPDMFLKPEPQGTVILPGRSADLSVAPLAVACPHLFELMPH